MAMAALRREGKRLAPLISPQQPLRSSLTSHLQDQAPIGVRSISTQVVRNRMKSVKNIQKITKAMKMVAASKLRAIQTRAENSRGLWQPFTALLGDTPSVDVKKNVVVTISSDKGLCGGINSTSVKISRVLHKLNSGPDKETKYVILGEKAKAQLIRDSKSDIELILTELQKNPLNYTQKLENREELNCLLNNLNLLDHYQDDNDSEVADPERPQVHVPLTALAVKVEELQWGEWLV
ncbi:hypothetical protein RIF29_19278 [Crotalaria pallida]|uniref:Uncharacterized protein n=1 Tax=Crotalaria pallida TaxID=3830 RepID=A0AAN9F101_CROPI